MILGLHGQARSGKDTCYTRLSTLWQGEHEDLRRLFPLGVKRIAFADRMKVAAMRALGILDDATAVWTANRLKDEGEITVSIGDEVWTLTGREYFQFAGDEGGRQIHGSNVWVDAALPPYFYSNPSVLHVVTDVRFDSEADRIIDLGGHVLEIEGEGRSADTHASERRISSNRISKSIKNVVRDDWFAALDRSLVSAVVELHDANV